MNAPSVDVKDILEAESALGLTFKEDLFVAEMPAEPDECVCVYDSGGAPPTVLNVMENPTVQVRVRGAVGDYLGGRALAAAVRDALNGRHGEVVNGARYISIFATGDVVPLSFDGRRRPEFTVNFQTRRTDAV